jgi:hypothetical protein
MHQQVTKSGGIRARNAAREVGLKAYLGCPCLRGHRGVRYTSSGACIQCYRIKGPKRCRPWDPVTLHRGDIT